MKYVGTTQPIHDAAGKAAGRTRYVADMVLPGMLYACFVRSTVPHGRVRAVRTEKAMALPGVVRVFHPFNTTQKKYNRYRGNFAQDDLPGEERAFKDYVRFVGDSIGAVVAEDPETARRAARLVEVDYEELPAALDFEEALAGKNCLSGEDAVKDEFSSVVGSAPEGEELIRVESFSELPRLHHAAMEPHGCVADYDPYTKQLCLWCPTQSVHGIRTVLSDYLEMPENRIRVIKTTMGGSFGGKQEWYMEPAAALMAISLGRPVKIVFSRKEAMLCTGVRAAMRAHLQGYFRPDGTLRSLSYELLLDAGAYMANSRDYVRAMSGKSFRCYAIAHLDFHARIVSTNTPVSGAYRGWSAPENAIFVEHLMDQAAVTLGIDPVVLREKNAVRPGQKDVKTGVPLENVQVREALIRGKERFDWEQKREEDTIFNRSQDRYRRGVGVGCGGHNSTYYPRFGDYAQADLRMNADGSVHASVTLHDHGCGTVTAVQMIIAEILGMDTSLVTVFEGDTAHTPVDFGCFSSRTTYVVGRAAAEAAGALKQKLLADAAVLYQKKPETLMVKDGAVYCGEDPGFCVSYGELAHRVMREYRRNLCASAQFHSDTNPGVTAAHFAHVEVDTWTGFTRVLEYLAVQDIGQPINEGMCRAQIQGAVQMGCGAALREKLTIAPDGCGTESLADYHVSLASDVPEVDVLLLTEGKSAEGPFGAKSVGEICYVPVAAAVCGAVNDALGGGLDVLPFTPDALLGHLAERRNGK